MKLSSKPLAGLLLAGASTAIIASAAIMASAAIAQEAPQTDDNTPSTAPAALSQTATENAEPGQNADQDATQDRGPDQDQDNVADKLNSMQQLEQTFTLTRNIDGEAVETEKRTVTYERGRPVRATEAGETTAQRLVSDFDGKVLTRTEAFEEAKLDFIVADKNRDGAMSADEFVGLVETWRENSKREAPAENEDAARKKQYRAFLSEIDPDGAGKEAAMRARRKFAFMAGAAETIPRKTYIAEYLVDFDAMDDNNDTLLKSGELAQFRAANRGETIKSAPVTPGEALTPPPADQENGQ